MEHKNDSEYGTEKKNEIKNSKYEDAKDNTSNGSELNDKELNELGQDYSRDPYDNSLIYTDPQSKIQYVLNSDKTDWVLKDKSNNTESQYDFDGTTYFHTNEKGIRYKWDLNDKQWIVDESKNANDIKSNSLNQNTEIEEEEESEEDENTTEEDRKRRQYRKRKAAPGWDKIQYQKVNNIHRGQTRIVHILYQQGPIPLMKY